jgi:hypothetical protein
MPTFLLYIKADLENISKIEVPAGGRFCVDVSSSRAVQQASSCSSLPTAAAAPATLVDTNCMHTQVKESAGSESRERVYVSSTDEHDLSGSKGTANFVSQWGGASHQLTPGRNHTQHACTSALSGCST